MRSLRRFSCYTACLLIIVMFGLFFTSGCGSREQTSSSLPADDKLTIVTSFYPMYIMALNITAGVPGMELVNLTEPQIGCLHDYQLRPADVKTLQNADIFIVNGAGMESFLDKVVKQQADLKIITASKGISMIRGTGTADDNPHVWVSIAGAIQEVNNISAQLAVLDPAHASQYKKNSEIYTVKLNKLRQDMHKKLDNLPNRNIISFHEAFPYFAKEFNLNIVAVVEREPGLEPSAAELAETIKIVRKAHVNALFVEPQYSTSAAEVIGRDTGAKVYTLDPAVTGSNTPDAYLDIMKKNLTTLSEALR